VQVLTSPNNAASTGSANVAISETGRISVTGTSAIGAVAETTGNGTTRITHAGSITATGNGVTGIWTQTGLTNVATHTVELSGTASVQISGDKSVGIYFGDGGASSVSYTLAGSSSISTTGVGSDGINAVLGTGSITARLAAATAITVTGAESIALNTQSAGIIDLAHAGTIRATGEYGVGILAQSAATATVLIGSGGSVLGGWQADVASVGPTTAFPSAGVLIAGATASLQNAGSIGALSDRAVADTGLAPGGNLALSNSGTVTGFVDLSAGGTNTWVNAAGGLFDVRHFADTNGDGTRDTKRVSISNFGAAATSSFDNQSGALVRLAQVAGDTAVDATGYYVPTTGVANTVLDATFYTLSRRGIVQGQFTNLGTFTNSGIIDLRGAQSGNTLVMTGNAIAGGAVSPAGGLFTSNGGQLLLNTIFNTGVPLGGQGNSFSDVLVVDRTSVASGPTGINILGRSGPGGETPGNGILLVEVRDPAASAPLAFALNGDYAEAGQQRVVGGAFAYALYQNGVGPDIADGNWYLRNVGISPNSGIYEDTPNILFPLIEMPVLQERVGNRYWAGRDPGNAPAPQAVFCKDAARNFVCTLTEDQASYYLTEDNRVVDSEGYWAQVTGLYGRYTPEITTHANGHDLAYFGLQAGRDTALLETDSGILLGGLSLRYGNVRGTSGTASLAAHGFGAGASLTYYDDSGLYFDGQAAATLFSREYTSSLMGRLAHDAMGLGYGFSLETGYRAAVSDKWALTPQVQLSYTNLAASTFTDRLGAVVSIEDGQSLEGRLGLAAEYQDSWKEADGTTSRLTLNAGANLYNEFLPDSRVSLSGFVLDSRKPGQWVGVSAGGTYNWNNDMNSLYGEIAANTSVANFGQSHELKGNLGLRVKW
jgi:outer membrane autotransporter protein